MDVPAPSTSTVDVLFQFIAEAAAKIAGFQVAALNVVRGEHYQVAAVAGSADSKAALRGKVRPLAELEVSLSRGEDWGSWRFIKAGTYTLDPGELMWIPTEVPPPTSEADWDPMDMLIAPLFSGGALIGMLCLDVPVDGQRPLRSQRHLLNSYADEAARALSAALDAERAAEHQRQAEELSARDDYRRQFVDTMTHELRNPLTSIQGHLELLAELASATDATNAVFQAARRSADRLGAIINDLLDLSRVSSPSDRETAVVDLNAVVQDVVDSAAGAAAARAISWDIELGGDAARVSGDTDELWLVVSNLVSNAVKYSPHGGRVRVAVRDDGECVTVTCADQGIGIPEADLGRVFEEFYRSADPRARAETGTGLGLAVVDRAVRRHRGSIEVASELGAGTTFVVRLPRGDAVVAA